MMTVRENALREAGQLHLVHKLVNFRTLQQHLKKKPPVASDVAWAWVAERQLQGDLQHLIRRRPRGGVEVNWQLQAMERAGWVEAERPSMALQTLDLMRLADWVMQTLKEKATRLRLFAEQGEAAEQSVFEMTPTL